MNRHPLSLRFLGIDTQREHVVYMRRDCHVCRSEGFKAQTRLEIALGARRIVATLNVIDTDLLAPGEAGLSSGAWHALGARVGDAISVSHASALDSLSAMRSKIYGHRLDEAALESIVRDIACSRYSDVQIAAFLAACAGGRMDVDETIALTRAMISVGETIRWPGAIIADKHCVGGLPGNRTTPIIVAIAAAAGLTMPKTSSRAITSPAGTADVVETLTNVELDLPAMRRVVEREGGCFVWGGALNLSPADDLLIRVERPLDMDSPAQLVASVLSKKIAAGATDVLIDIPVGPTAKLRTEGDALVLQDLLGRVAAAFDLRLRVVLTSGIEPIGNGIGPALEARDVVAVLRGRSDAPADLRTRALDLAGALLDLCEHDSTGRQGRRTAEQLLHSGEAWRKFAAICEAQGRMSVPAVARIRAPIVADRAGVLDVIDNRRLAQVAKLAGAPGSPAAGLELHVHCGARVERGMPLFTLHAESQGELDYAKAYYESHPVFEMVDAR